MKKDEELIPELITELRNYLIENYEPITDPTKADSHLSTMEIYDKLQRLIPGGKRFTPADVATWLHSAGFTFYDYGSLQFDWLLKRRSSEN